MDADDLLPETREERYCEEHDLIHVKNAMGRFVCPFCEADY